MLPLSFLFSALAGQIADKYDVKGSANQMVLQDFDSFKQSLNIASSDQRLLVFAVSPQSEMTAVKMGWDKLDRYGGQGS